MADLFTLRAASGLPADPAALGASTLIMIDCQNTYTRGPLELAGGQAALDQAEELLDRARSAGIPIIHVQHDDFNLALARAKTARRDRDTAG